MGYNLNMKIFTNGCFDILHRGHIELLNYCASLGDVTVGLNSDDSVKRLKGEGRPINRALDRKFVLEGLKAVNKVIVFDEDTPYNLIKVLSPDLIVKGGDYSAHEVIGRDICRVEIFQTILGYSTSDYIKKITAK